MVLIKERDQSGAPVQFDRWKRGRVVDCTGLENRRCLTIPVSSNLTASAKSLGSIRISRYFLSSFYQVCFQRNVELSDTLHSTRPSPGELFWAADVFSVAAGDPTRNRLCASPGRSINSCYRVDVVPRLHPSIAKARFCCRSLRSAVVGLLDQLFVTRLEARQSEHAS
jgi:hypothetical protein